MVERVQDSDSNVVKAALDLMRDEIRSSTASMTAIPKPLKYLRPFYDKLDGVLTRLGGRTHQSTESIDETNRISLADILSVLAMTFSEKGDAHSSLLLKLGGTPRCIGEWGYEFVRHIAAEMGSLYKVRIGSNASTDDLQVMLIELLKFMFDHASEPEACDLLMEMDQIAKVKEFCTKSNYKRVCLYLTSCANYVPEPEDNDMRRIVAELYGMFGNIADQLRIAMRINDTELLQTIWDSCTDNPSLQKQMAYMCAEHNIVLNTSDDDLLEIMNNANLSEFFLSLARDLEVMEAKTPDDVYKVHLSEGRSAIGGSIDSARQNLASTFVNAFVNAGFGHDKLLTGDSQGSKWIHRNKDHGMLSATASLGCVLLWDVNVGLNSIVNYLQFQDDNIKAGALMAIGIISANIRSDCDPVFALLSDYIPSTESTPNMKVGAVVGIGLAYAGTNHEGVLELLSPIVENSGGNVELVSLAALSLGLVFVGSCNFHVVDLILTALLELSDGALHDSTMYRFLGLGLGLLFMGQQEAVDVTIEAVQIISNQRVRDYVKVTLESLAYAGTGNVLKIQKLLSICLEHPKVKKNVDSAAPVPAAEPTEEETAEVEKNQEYQAVAVLGLSLVAMGEELGAEMMFRSFDHLLQYGDPVIRRTVPLAIGLLSLSNPRPALIDILSKMSHDSDLEVAQSAVYSLGLIGAGSNNSRIGALLRALATYYGKDPPTLFIVRIAQGLLHLGKGLLTLSPFHSDRLLVSNVAIGGLLAMLHACLDMKGTILDKRHYMLFYIVSAMRPRMLITVSEEGAMLPVSVRVGQAVDTVAQAGHPKVITGFQTHTTPVLLGSGERAELATNEYLSLAPVLEGVVILKKNPEYQA